MCRQLPQKSEENLLKLVFAADLFKKTLRNSTDIFERVRTLSEVFQIFLKFLNNVEISSDKLKRKKRVSFFLFFCTLNLPKEII